MANTAVIVYTVKGGDRWLAALPAGHTATGSVCQFSSLANDLYVLDTADNPKRSIIMADPLMVP